MSDKMVKVGCRMPNGLRLQVSDWVKGPDGNMILKPIAIYDLAGSGQHLGMAPGNVHTEEDATFTEIPADHWEKWYEMNKDSDLATSGTVFRGKASDKTPEEQAEAEAPSDDDKSSEPEPTRRGRRPAA